MLLHRIALISNRDTELSGPPSVDSPQLPSVGLSPILLFTGATKHKEDERELKYRDT